MKFVENIDKEKYENFVMNHQKAHFMQSWEWGQFAIKGKKQIPLYVGMEDDNGNLLCAALLLKKSMPFGLSYVYCPRGYVIDFKNSDLLTQFTYFLKKYMHDNKIVYLKIDPDIKYQDIDELAKPVVNGENNYEIFDNLIKLGYQHKGFYKLYEGNQPRYTFRIDLTKTKEEIDSKMSKSFLKSVKRSYTYFLEIDNEPRIKEFCDLNKFNSGKDGFTPYTETYYQEFYKYFNEQSHVKFFNASVNIRKVLESIETELKEIENKKLTEKKHLADLENQEIRLKKDYEMFKKYDVDKLLVCSLICVYAGEKAWSLYIGSDELANYTFAVSRCYYDSIIDAKEMGYKIYDLFGTVGDPSTNYKNLAHLHDFKRKFGDEYIEFMGEFDLVNNKFMYKMLPGLLKVYRTIRKLK